MEWDILLLPEAFADLGPVPEEEQHEIHHAIVRLQTDLASGALQPTRPLARPPLNVGQWRVHHRLDVVQSTILIDRVLPAGARTRRRSGWQR